MSTPLPEKHPAPPLNDDEKRGKRIINKSIIILVPYKLTLNILFGLSLNPSQNSLTNF